MYARLKMAWTYEELALLLHAGIEPDVISERPNLEWEGPLTQSPEFVKWGYIRLLVPNQTNTLVVVLVLGALGSAGGQLRVEWLSFFREPFCEQVNEKGQKS